MNEFCFQIIAFNASFEIGDKAVIFIFFIIKRNFERVLDFRIKSNASYIRKIFFGCWNNANDFSDPLDHHYGLFFVKISIYEPDKSASFKPSFGHFNKLFKSQFLKDFLQSLLFESWSQKYCVHHCKGKSIRLLQVEVSPFLQESLFTLVKEIFLFSDIHPFD